MMLLGVLPALLIMGLLVGGTWMWWLATRSAPRPRRLSRHERDAQAALRRHPAGRDRWLEPDNLRALMRPEEDAPASGQPTGPEDDPEFISALERLIRGEDPGGPGEPGGMA
jgi:hypothetical protein